MNDEQSELTKADMAVFTDFLQRLIDGEHNNLVQHSTTCGQAMKREPRQQQIEWKIIKFNGDSE